MHNDPRPQTRIHSIIYHYPTLVIKPRKEELGKTSTGLKRGSRASASGETAALAQSRMNKEEYGEAARDLDEIYLMHGPDSQDFKQYAEVIAGEYSRAKFQGVIGAFYAGVLGDLLIDVNFGPESQK